MKEKRAVGFYFVILAGIAAIISAVRFMMWAPAHNAMDMFILLSLIVGFAVDVLLVFKDNDFLTILATAAYSAAAVKLLTNSVGSFVDAIQGISMFGDASQVNNIISIAIVMGAGILLSILTSFLKRVKE